MTVVNAVLGTLTFLLITAAFTFTTWWLFKLALKEEPEIEQANKEQIA